MLSLKPDDNFEIYVDSSCVNTPMDEQTQQQPTGVSETPAQEVPPEDAKDKLAADVNTMTDGSETTAKKSESERAPSIQEHEEEHTIVGNDEQAEIHQSIEEDHPDDLINSEDRDHDGAQYPHSGSRISYVHPTVTDEGCESSSQHEATDEDVFSDKSPRSSVGSYDGGSEQGKDTDNMTTVTHSPRISDISQYEKEEFIPTARGTPRPPFRTPSDVRAMQMSSPPSSVLGSPRSTKRQFPTVSRLGTPTASAQYSPKRRSTPPRFKSRKEQPLVLLHVTLLPLRWVWGELLNSLDTAELSEQAKTLRDSWRILQDRVGDTVIERGILLGHPQNDYEVLEERLLEALELPVRCRARILECGHYLGPSNEMTITDDEESEDDYGYESERRRASSKRHWCGTCKNEIRYEALGTAKLFRIKVYASNGLMKAGAWEACWKEMERVDVELEPVVEPDVQDELVRLAATQEERELANQEEAEIAREVAHQLEQQKQKEEADMLHAHFEASSPSPQPEPEHRQPEPEPDPEPEHVRRSSSAEDQWRESEQERHRRDEERMREIYGDTPPPHQSRSPSRESSTRPQEDSHDPHTDSYNPPPSSQSPSEEAYERREPPRHNYQQASFPELLLQSVRVLMQDRKNVVIFTLSVFVLMLALRRAPTEAAYEPNMSMGGMKDVPVMQHAPVVQSQPNQHVIQEPPTSALESVQPVVEPHDPDFEEAPVQESAATIVKSVVPLPASNHDEAFAQEPLPAVESDMPPPMTDHDEAPAQEASPATEPAISSSVPNDEEAPSVEVEQEQHAPREEPEAKFESTKAVPSREKCQEPPAAMAAEPAPEPVQESAEATASDSSDAAAPPPPPPSSASATYRPCDVPAPSKPAFSAVASEPEPPHSEVTETVTQRTVMRVVRTVTETEVQTAVETETAFETVRVTSTEVVKASASAPTPEIEFEAKVEEAVMGDNCTEAKEDLELEPEVSETAVSGEAAVSDEVEVETETDPVAEVPEEASSTEADTDAEVEAHAEASPEAEEMSVAEAEPETAVEMGDEESAEAELSKDQILMRAAECENLRAIVAEQLAAESAARKVVS
ncbi:hypothetical protein F4779DRAFT_603440 [Xylariaceae sp. FL0662B]|nr:hypothetical protein F4779DRAFT_603440 [Xylariaceae sp. FL0662B]